MLVARVISYFLQPQTLTAIAALCGSYFLIPLITNWLHVESLKKSNIDAPIINLKTDRDFAAAAERYLHHFRDILTEGYEKFKHGVYQVWGIDGYIVIVSPDFLEELNALGTDFLDFHAASQKRIIGEYEWLRIADSLEAHTVLTDLTRQIGALIPDIHGQLEHALGVEFPPCKEWTPVAVWPKMFRTMALVVSLMTVGPELCRDEYWLNIMIKFVDDIFIGGWELKTYSLLTRPIAARTGWIPGIRRVWKHQANARNLLVPIIHKRRKAEAEARAAGRKYQKPNDMLQWLTDNATKTNPPRSDGNVAELCLLVSFAALHAASVTLSNIVLDLAARPEYAEPLREEYRVAKEKYQQGLNEKQALLVSSLSKLDSFIKESQRMNPVTITSFSRLVRKPFMLSTGLHLPKGTHILVPAGMISMDPNLYPSPHEFQGFRFHEKRTAASGDGVHKYQFTTTSPQQMHFGFGRQACPGRFFASAAIKCTIVHLLEGFDIKLVNEADGRPKNIIKGAMSTPSETVEVLFRRKASVRASGAKGGY